MIRNGFNPNDINDDQETALHCLTKANAKGLSFAYLDFILKYFIEYANGYNAFSLKDKNGNTPYDNIQNNTFDKGNEIFDKNRKSIIIFYLNQYDKNRKTLYSKIKFLSQVVWSSIIIKRWIGFSPIIKSSKQKEKTNNKQVLLNIKDGVQEIFSWIFSINSINAFKSMFKSYFKMGILLVEYLFYTNCPICFTFCNILFLIGFFLFIGLY